MQHVFGCMHREDMPVEKKLGQARRRVLLSGRSVNMTLLDMHRKLRRHQPAVMLLRRLLLLLL